MFCRWDSSNLSQHVSTTVLKATEYLKSEQPSQAAVVLDGVTMLLLSSDGERYIELKLLLQEISLTKQRKSILLCPAKERDVHLLYVAVSFETVHLPFCSSSRPLVLLVPIMTCAFFSYVSGLGLLFVS